jgi:hypothetical protein
VEHSDQIMLVTDKGQLIRCPVEDIRIAGRSTQGVIVFDTAEDEHVVSVEHIGDDGETASTGTAGSTAGLESSPGGAQRNPGSVRPLAQLSPDFAALHPGYDASSPRVRG